ncbi:Protein translocase subunit SECA2 [Hibiscus syriacus]|uniref:Protein translocase subunit SECA2 n=1 Tax=Hibiscus syriacus TaxID=106335 RepID=A0A6A3BCJ0_HIBSY|nr:Protein translocase subunit SECA2 [Hibiscus syriacus]
MSQPMSLKELQKLIDEQSEMYPLGPSIAITYLSVLKDCEVHCTKEGSEVKRLGGLHVIGTSLHESRRIDNQLRGRAGRQGDPGSTRFMVSLQDEMFQKFNFDTEWAAKLISKITNDEDIPIEGDAIVKQLLGLQINAEKYFFNIRKSLVEFDEVLEVQRKHVYDLRQLILTGDDESCSQHVFQEVTYPQSSWILRGIANNYLKNDSVGDCLRSNSKLKVGNGKSISFWNDAWVDESSLKFLFPRIFVLSPNKEGKVVEFGSFEPSGWVWNVQTRRNLCDCELVQWMDLMSKLKDIQLSELVEDFLSWSASGDGLYSVKSCRNTLASEFGGSALWIQGVWIGLAPPRVEAFLWRLAHQKVAVKAELVKRGSLLDRMSLFFIVRFRLTKWFLAKFPKITIQEDVLIDFLKMNVDGAVRLDDLGGGIGGILRDWNCCTLLTFSENVSQGTPPLAELKAIKRGIEIFLSSRWEFVGRLIVESDCSSAVEWIQSPVLAPVFLSHLVYQISTLITGKVHSVRLIPRACNGEADSLAKKGRPRLQKLPLPFLYPGVSADSFAAISEEDLLESLKQLHESNSVDIDNFHLPNLPKPPDGFRGIRRKNYSLQLWLAICFDGSTKNGRYRPEVNLLRKHLGDVLIATYLNTVQESGYDDAYIKDIELLIFLLLEFKEQFLSRLWIASGGINLANMNRLCSACSTKVNYRITLTLLVITYGIPRAIFVMKADSGQAKVIFDYINFHPLKMYLLHLIG